MGMFQQLFVEKPNPTDQSLTALLQTKPEEVVATQVSATVQPKVDPEKLMEAMKGLNLGGMSEPVAPAQDHPEVTLAQEIAQTSEVTKVEAPIAPVEIPATVAELSAKPVKVFTERIKGYDTQKEVTERVFVLTYLEEVHKLVTMGEQLETMTRERMDRADARKGNEGNNSALENSAKQIEESLKALVEAAEYPKFSEALTKLLSDLQVSADILKVEIQSKEKEERIADNALLAKINQTKAEIANLVNTIGTQLNFERIKRVIRDTEGVSIGERSKALEDNIPKAIIDDVSEMVIKEINGNLPDGQIHINMGILEFLMKVYTPRQ